MQSRFDQFDFYATLVSKSIIITFDFSQILIVHLIVWLPEQDFSEQVKNPAQVIQAPLPSQINPA